MGQIKSIILYFTILFLLTSCQQASKLLHETLIHTSHDVKAEHHALEKCDFQKAQEIVSTNKSLFLRNAEEGLLSFYQRDFTKSRQYFETAIDIYRQDENRPVVAVSKYVISDYCGDGYDKVLLHNYNALNYLLMGNLEDAKVETRNSDFIQQKERQQFYEKIRDYEKVKKRYEGIINRYEVLFQNVNPAHNPYQNPFAFYISALLYEESGKFDEALIDIRHALQFDKESSLLHEKRTYYSSQRAPAPRRVELFFDIGRSPVKTEERIAVKVSDKEEKLYFPSYVLYLSDIEKIELCNSAGSVVATSSTLSDINAIEINAFKKELPDIINSIVTEGVKEAVADGLQKNVPVVAPFYQMFKVIYSHRNQLSWTTLPQKIDVISFVPQKGEVYMLKAVDKNGKILDTKQLEWHCSKKFKNCYMHYLLKNNRFCSVP